MNIAWTPIAILSSGLIAAGTAILTNFFQAQRDKNQWERQKLFETYDATLQSLFHAVAIEQEYKDILVVRHEFEKRMTELDELERLTYTALERDNITRAVDKHNKLLEEFKLIYCDFRKNLNLLYFFYKTNDYSSTAMTISRRVEYFKKIPVGRPIPEIVDVEDLLQCSQELIKAMQLDSRLQ